VRVTRDCPGLVLRHALLEIIGVADVVAAVGALEQVDVEGEHGEVRHQGFDRLSPNGGWGFDGLSSGDGWGFDRLSSSGEWGFEKLSPNGVPGLAQASSAARICSSTSFALTGMGVPGP
jgi:hypothetical protein